jgi:hypothetical protein
MERLRKHIPGATDTHTRMNDVVYASRAEELQGRQLGQSSQYPVWSRGRIPPP